MRTNPTNVSAYLLPLKILCSNVGFALDTSPYFTLVVCPPDPRDGVMSPYISQVVNIESSEVSGNQEVLHLDHLVKCKV